MLRCPSAPGARVASQRCPILRGAVIREARPSDKSRWRADFFIPPEIGAGELAEMKVCSRDFALAGPTLDALS